MWGGCTTHFLVAICPTEAHSTQQYDLARKGRNFFRLSEKGNVSIAGGGLLRRSVSHLPHSNLQHDFPNGGTHNHKVDVLLSPESLPILDGLISCAFQIRKLRDTKDNLQQAMCLVWDIGCWQVF